MATITAPSPMSPQITCKLRANDKPDDIVVLLNVAKMFSRIETMLADLYDTANFDEPINLPEVTSDILEKILVWCNQHVEDPSIKNPDKYVETINEWDTQFCNTDIETALKLMVAVNNLGNEALMNLLSKSFAVTRIQGKTTQEIRDMLGIAERGGFTEEEDKMNAEEADWCEEMS